MTATAQPKLTASQARKLALKEVRVAQLKAQLEAEQAELADLHEQYKPRLQPSTDPRDAGKDVVMAEVGGFRIRCSTFIGGDYFSLKDYRTAGHPVTEEMAEHIRPGDPRERWTVKDLRGPRRPDAVEPS